MRRLWDEAVAVAIGYGQYGDETEEEQEWDEADEPSDTEED